jgi:ABC-type antimicrobial peptide transport system permease subunit
MQALLFGVTPYDPAMLAVSCASLTVVALFAGYLASFRATRLNPLDALRQG